VLPWENPRWIRAFVAILIANVAIVFAFSRFTQIKPLIALAWVVILSNLGILVWFVFQIHFRNRKTLRNTLLVFVGGDALIACSAILYVRSKTLYAVIPILIILVLRRFWGPPLIEKLQAEIEQEKSQSNPA
jgi:FtsH-binding integral membrane protein